MRGAVIVLGMLAVLVGATDVGARDCAAAGRSVDADYARYNRKDRADEALRLKRADGLAARQDGRLRLKLDGGRSVELADCPYGRDARWYLFERYDRPGRFYVVRTQSPDDFSYTLVMMPTGERVTVHGSPVWASEKSRFLTVACSLQPPRAALHIQAPAGDTLETEATFPLPCDTESCSARWDRETWIAVTCVPRESGQKGTEYVVIRNRDGEWNRFGR